MFGYGFTPLAAKSAVWGDEPGPDGADGELIDDNGLDFELIDDNGMDYMVIED